MRKKLRILIVDDDVYMTRTLSDILTLQGYDPTTAHSGAEALASARETTFDCVLTDIKMPEMNGVELFRELIKLQPHLPVILMTAYIERDLIQNAMESGLIGILQKPVGIRPLLAFFESLANCDNTEFTGNVLSLYQKTGIVLE